MHGHPDHISHPRRTLRGMSFMELMFVLLILGALLTLALPGYRRHVLAAHRAEGTQALHHLHLAQERFRSRQTRYARSLQELGQPELSPNSRYRLSVAQSTADGYVLEAEAQGQQAQDRPCIKLRLTQSFGQVTHQGLGTSTEQSAGCWPQ